MRYLILVVVIFLAACGPSAEQVGKQVVDAVSATQVVVVAAITKNAPTAQPTFTQYPTYTPYPTLTLAPTQTAWIVVITATSSPTPEYTPTETNTPEPTKDPLQADKEPGFYLVGVDIAPGIWRSTGSGGDCYWAVTSKNDDIINNNFGDSGVTVNIPSSGFQVEFGEHCGTWTYLGQ